MGNAVQIISDVYNITFDQYGHFNLATLAIPSTEFISAYIVGEKTNRELKIYSYDSTVMFAMDDAAGKSFSARISYWKALD